MEIQEILQNPKFDDIMKDIRTYDKNIEKEIKDYKDFVNIRMKLLPKRANKLGEAFQKFSSADYSNQDSTLNELKQLLFDGKKTMQEVLSDGLENFFYGLMPKEIARKHCEIVLRQQEYTYLSSTYRRSFRAKEPSAYISVLASIMSSVYTNWYDFDFVTFFCMSNEEKAKGKQNTMGSSMMSEWIALEIDGKNDEVIAAVKDTILSENNVRIMDHTFMKGMAKSHNKEIYGLMSQLLLAAKLQEGLRQIILETADEGTIEYFIQMIKTVLDYNLLRFSACIRAVGVWMGLGYGYEDKRIIEKLLNLGYQNLIDEEKRSAACESKDVLEMFAAMWAESVFYQERLHIYIETYLKGEKYKKMVALYFLKQVQRPEYCTKLVSKYLDEEDMDVLSWILFNYELTSGWSDVREDYLENCRNNEVLNKKEERDKQFASLTAILQRIPKDGYYAGRKPFDWCNIGMKRDTIFSKLLIIIGFDEDLKKTETLIELSEYASSQNQIQFMNLILNANRSEKERAYVFRALTNKSIAVRIAAVKILKQMTLNEEEILKVEDLLSLKTAEIRQTALEILKDRDTEAVHATIERLIADKKENKRLAALDIINNLSKADKIKQEKVTSFITLMPKITEREKVMIEEIQSKDLIQYTSANGFGLYDVKDNPKWSALESVPEYTLKTFRSITAQDCIETLTSLMKLIENHKDYTFMMKQWDQSETEILFGTCKSLCVPAENEDSKQKIEGFDRYVLSDVWRNWVEDNHVSLLMITKINYITSMLNYSNKYILSYFDWVISLIESQFGRQEVEEVAAFLKKQAYGSLARDIIINLPAIFENDEILKLNYGILSDLIQQTKEEEWKKPIDNPQKRYYYYNMQNFTENQLSDTNEIFFFINNMSWVKDGDSFLKRVHLCYEISRLTGKLFVGLNEVDIAAAVTRNILSVNELYRIFLNKNPDQKLGCYTGHSNQFYQKNMKLYPILEQVKDTIVYRVIEIEVKRGDTPTEVSHMANAISNHQGIENFVKILLALGNETLTRGYTYGAGNSKKDVLSSLLKASRPASEDDEKKLANLIQGRIPEVRLLEAALYAPKWISIIEKYLRWKGLKSCAWYFHAHTSNGVLREFEAEVAKYSSISIEDFKDGAFDVHWFKSAYKTLGKERFETLYKCAKYISSGSVHRRAQIFTDAALGKLDLKETKNKIADKRNKDLLLSYSLIPFKRNKMKDALERYEFIQNFLQESKQFGSQRRASEGKVCEIALGNLARTLGYDDTLRFSWKMEILKLDQIASYFEPKTLEDFQVWIDKSSIEFRIQKKEKALKSFPAKLKKHPYIGELKDIRSSLKLQFKRARKSFERAMEHQDVFPFIEIADLMKHPVIHPIVTKLVFQSGDKLGFLTEEGLQELDGNILSLENNDELIVAHSYHLYQSGKWSNFQRYALENGIVQPFKQIFRELYLLNDDEKKEKTISRRYAGNQIQPNKTLALLKGRDWTVDYDQGLLKVNYKENVIASMYALADWFSPGDVEAPTLETVEFRNRNTHKPMELEKLSAVFFSETMRDIDLVVSVAHVGGVDPLASHSTIEMREMIVREIAELLKLSNVSVQGSHCKISGSKGEYTVHLGSGIVHMMGKGAINILPVHSQHRGKIFLPFVDEDPKTAEILSKILLLAEDNKIKDATILSQIINN